MHDNIKTIYHVLFNKDKYLSKPEHLEHSINVRCRYCYDANVVQNLEQHTPFIDDNILVTGMHNQFCENVCLFHEENEDGFRP